MFVTADEIRMEAMRQASRQKTNKLNPAWDDTMRKAAQISINDLVLLQQMMDDRFSLVLWVADTQEGGFSVGS